MYFVPYNKSLKEFSRQLRNNSTLSEVILWNKLKAKKILGFQFNRQKPLDNFIVDFYCKKLQLVIEVDGNSHDHEDVRIKDEKRQQVLESIDLKFLRFHDMEVKWDLMNVLRVIEDYITEWEKEHSIEKR